MASALDDVIHQLHALDLEDVEHTEMGAIPIAGWEVLPVLAFPLLGPWMAKKVEARVNVGVWAECKDTKDNLGRETVALLKHHVDDVRRKKYGWKPTIVYLVASGRFDPNAIRLANAYGFICMEERDNEFQEAVSPVT